jgi:hypothetical protein
VGNGHISSSGEPQAKRDNSKVDNQDAKEQTTTDVVSNKKEDVGGGGAQRRMESRG